MDINKGGLYVIWELIYILKQENVEEQGEKSNGEVIDTPLESK